MKISRILEYNFAYVLTHTKGKLACIKLIITSLFMVIPSELSSLYYFVLAMDDRKVDLTTAGELLSNLIQAA